MKISIIGTGYVGLVTGVCLAYTGHKILCCDIDEDKIKSLKTGKSPIYEEGLEEMMKPLIEKEDLLFTSDIKKSIEFSDVVFICVGTPSKDDGSVNLDYVKSVCESINKYAKINIDINNII